jgi:hypothetical protein
MADMEEDTAVTVDMEDMEDTDVGTIKFFCGPRINLPVSFNRIAGVTIS